MLKWHFSLILTSVDLHQITLWKILQNDTQYDSSRTYILLYMYFIITNLCIKYLSNRLLIIGRFVRVMRIARILFLMIQQKRHIATASRRIVSQNKRRYQRDGFDLDLCYITGKMTCCNKFRDFTLVVIFRNIIIIVLCVLENVSKFINSIILVVQLRRLHFVVETNTL